MKLTTASRTFQLLSRILDVRTSTEPFLPTAAEKPSIPLGAVSQPFPRATPESQGVSSRHIQNFLEELNRDRVNVTRQEGIYTVEAPWLERIMLSVDFDDSESLQYFQRVLIQTGVIDALREAGCDEGDTVDIYGLEFDFVE